MLPLTRNAIQINIYLHETLKQGLFLYKIPIELLPYNRSCYLTLYIKPGCFKDQGHTNNVKDNDKPKHYQIFIFL
mgnify:CR=1 FL=1